MNGNNLYFEWLMNIDVQEKLASAVIELRSRRGESQRQFALVVGVSYAAIRSWENFESMPGTKNLERIAALRGESLEQFLAFLRGHGEQTQPPNKTVEEIFKDTVSLSRSELARLIQMLVEKLAVMDA